MGKLERTGGRGGQALGLRAGLPHRPHSLPGTTL